MSIQRCLILGWMLAGLQVLSAAQNMPPQDASSQSSGQNTSQSPAQSSNQNSTQSPDDTNSRTAPAAALSAIAGIQGDSGTDDTRSDLPLIPALLGGAGISSTFLSNMQRSNYLRGGVNVGATYDDNPLLVSGGAESNTSETIFPNINISQSTSRTRWTLGYAGGLTVNQKITSQNQGSHNLVFDSQYRLSPHVNLRVAETFSLTTGFFDAGNGGQTVIGSGGPNPSLITPLATQRSSTTTVEANYHFALNDLVGASGSFYDLNFTNVPTGVQQLSNSQTASGSAFWLHRLFRGDWGGVSYRFDRITFSPNGESRVHSFYAVDTLNLSDRFSITGFIGPQYSLNQGLVVGTQQPTQPTQSNQWSVAGGVEGGWKNQKTSLTAGYSRGITDGGGLVGSVRLQNVHAVFSRELLARWSVAMNASHGSNDTLVASLDSSATSINVTSAGFSLGRTVQKSIGLRFGYAHDFQQQFGLPAPNTTLGAHSNRVFVTLSYQWAKPLGM